MRDSGGLKSSLGSSTSLKDSLFERAGDLIHRLDQIKDKCSLVPLEFPQIIVVGEECSGKSTVLERIAMLEFFPRERTSAICTRMPTKLKLVHKSVVEMMGFCRENNLSYSTGAIYMRMCYQDQQTNNHLWSKFFDQAEVTRSITEYTQSAVSARNGRVTGVIEDVMLIEVTSNIVANLTLVDLPGIVGAKIGNEPDDMMEQTRRLVEKYVAQPHTLVIAIVPAYQRIRNAQCMQIIQKYRKERMSLGVLTMADKAFLNIRPDDPYHELKQRLDGTAFDLVDLPLGYVAVKNRDSNLRAQQSLQESATEEIAWFAANLPGYKEQGKATSDALVDKLVTMLCNYVKSEWVPKAKEAINTQINSLNSRFSTLGDWPSATQQYITSLIGVFASNSIILSASATSLRSAFKPVTPRGPEFNRSSDIWDFVSNFSEIAPVLEELYQKAEEIIHSLPKVLSTMIEPAFQNKSLPSNLSRFANLHQAIRDFLLSGWDSILHQKGTKVLSDLRVQLLHAEAMYYGNFYGGASNYYYNVIVGTICHKLIKPCIELLKNTQSITQHISQRYADKLQFLVEESQEIKEQRNKWTREIQDLKEALTALDTIA